jgi:hypothetical protein
VLKEGDQDDPVIDPIDGKTCEGRGTKCGKACLPEVGGQVNLKNVKEPEFSDRVAQSGGPKEDPDIRYNYLRPLFGGEDCRIGIKI